jgi:phosphoribosylanthranilate isomerase
LFDTRSAGRFGGTGTPFPWHLAREAAGDIPFLVAGGIGPSNAAEAVAASGAIGVDVSSGLESSPGVKDPDLLRALFATLEGMTS